MRKLIIVVPDDKMALVEKLVEAIPGMEIVEDKDMDSIEEFQRKPPMERLDFAIRRIDSEEGLLMLCVSSKAGDPFYSCLKYEVK